MKLLIETNDRSELHIKQFEEKNKQLIKEVGEEKQTVTSNIKYIEAYKSLVAKLRAYKENLPLQKLPSPVRIRC